MKATKMSRRNTPSEWRSAQCGLRKWTMTSVANKMAHQLRSGNRTVLGGAHDGEKMKDTINRLEKIWPRNLRATSSFGSVQRQPNTQAIEGESVSDNDNVQPDKSASRILRAVRFRQTSAKRANKKTSRSQRINQLQQLASNPNITSYALFHRFDFPFTDAEFKAYYQHNMQKKNETANQLQRKKDFTAVRQWSVIQLYWCISHVPVEIASASTPKETKLAKNKEKNCWKLTFKTYLLFLNIRFPIIGVE